MTRRRPCLMLLLLGAFAACDVPSAEPGPEPAPLDLAGDPGPTPTQDRLAAGIAGLDVDRTQGEAVGASIALGIACFALEARDCAAGAALAAADIAADPYAAVGAPTRAQAGRRSEASRAILARVLAVEDTARRLGEVLPREVAALNAALARGGDRARLAGWASQLAAQAALVGTAAARAQGLADRTREMAGFYRLDPATSPYGKAMQPVAAEMLAAAARLDDLGRDMAAALSALDPGLLAATAQGP